MTVAPLPRPRGDRLITAPSRPRPKPPRNNGRTRRRAILTVKLLLPVLALALLASIPLWPELMREVDFGRVTFRKGNLSAEMQAGKLLNVRYRGTDGRNRPYTVTADNAVQVSPDRINLVEPKGDVTSENGSWTYIQSKEGVYMQHLGQLDLSGDVTMFRDNGVTLRTPVASVDLKAGAAASNEPTRAEGPFGVLDAQGFALVDKGAVIQFQGKSRLLLNGSHR